MTNSRASQVVLLQILCMVLPALAFAKGHFSWHPAVAVFVLLASTWVPRQLQLAAIGVGLALLGGWWGGLWGFGFQETIGGYL